MKEVDLLEIRLRMETLITQRQGMIAENDQRNHCGNSMAYTASDFMGIETRLLDLLSELREAQRGVR